MLSFLFLIAFADFAGGAWPSSIEVHEQFFYVMSPAKSEGPITCISTTDYDPVTQKHYYVFTDDETRTHYKIDKSAWEYEAEDPLQPTNDMRFFKVDYMLKTEGEKDWNEPRHSISIRPLGSDSDKEATDTAEIRESLLLQVCLMSVSL
ncbi:MAG: hypothetical protein HRT61_24510 [Ekhidna sp.]|nr:hypothetical protein [Ekhidna sp.]